MPADWDEGRGGLVLFPVCRGKAPVTTKPCRLCGRSLPGHRRWPRHGVPRRQAAHVGCEAFGPHETPTSQAALLVANGGGGQEYMQLWL